MNCYYVMVDDFLNKVAPRKIQHDSFSNVLAHCRALTVNLQKYFITHKGQLVTGNIQLYCL